MDLATRLTAMKIDDAVTAKADKLDPLPVVDLTKHSYLERLPVELECMIYSYLSVRDLFNLGHTNERSLNILSDNENSKEIARCIIARDTQRLRDQIEYLNFSGLSLVTAFRRYIRKHGLCRYPNYAPQCRGFARNYFQANPGQYRDEHEVELVASFALMVSDWLQYYGFGTGCTPLAGYIEANYRYPSPPNWRDVLRRLCLSSEVRLPEVYPSLVEMWKLALLPSILPQAIELLFEQVRHRPLVDLSECPGSTWPWHIPLNVDSQDAGKEFWEIPDGLLERLDLPKTFCGLSIHVCTAKKRGKKTTRQFVRHGDQSGLLLAELMKDLKIVWG